MTSPIRKSTPTAGLEVVLGLKPLDLVAREFGLSDIVRLRPRIRWDGIGFGKARGHLRTWLGCGTDLDLGKGEQDRSGLRCFNWDPPCQLANKVEVSNDTMVCAVFTERVGDLTRFNSISEGGIFQVWSHIDAEFRVRTFNVYIRVLNLLREHLVTWGWGKEGW